MTLGNGRSSDGSAAGGEDAGDGLMPLHCWDGLLPWLIDDDVTGW